MICSKCNSEIPNGAKFCTVCGTPCAASEPAKTFCVKCGLELAPGAKFCTSCGASTAASPVTLNKEPSADDLVAAMNTAAPASAPTPAPAPAPAAAVPTPVPAPAPAPVPTPTAPAASVAPPVQAPAASVMPQPGYNNGFAPTGAPAAPQMPNFAPTSGQMPPAGDAAGFNGAAVAAAVVPDKVKKSPVGKIVLIIAIVLVALIGGAAGWFFANKASFLSTFMGKSKYAAMVEKETFKEISKELDTAQLSSQIKAVSSVAGSFVTQQMNSMLGGYGFMSDKSANAEYAPMMNYYDNPFEGVDISGMIKSYHEFMQTTYGANAISGKITLNVQDLGGLDDADEVLDILNGTTITYNFAASEDAIGTIVGAEFGNGSEFDIKAVAEDDGSIYIAFPFASKTGFKIKTTASYGSAATTGTEGLDLDPDELDRLLEELVNIYTDHVKSASVTMDKGSLFVSGREVSGKLIVADINGKNFENLFKEMFEHIANDAYFSTQIVEYINNFDDTYTVSDFKNDVTDLVSVMNGLTESDKIVIRTIVNNSGKTLAKSFALVTDGEQEMEILFADNDAESEFEIKIEGETLMNVSNVKTDEHNGTITVNVSSMDSANSFISVIVEYSGVDKVTYGKTEVEVGTYTVKMNVPRNFEDLDDDEIDALNNSSFTIGTTVSGNTINYNIGATISGVAKFDLNMDLTYSDDTSALTPPSDVIDITDIANGAEPDKATQDKLTAFLGELMTAVENSGLEEIFGDLGGGSIIGSDPNPTNPTNPTNPINNDLLQKYYDLEDEVWEAYFEVYDWTGAYNISYGSKAYEKAKEYQDKLYDLIDRMGDVTYSDDPQPSESELNDFKKEYEDITKDAESILKALWSESTVPNKPEPTLPFTGHGFGSEGGVYDANGNLITTPAFSDEEMIS